MTREERENALHCLKAMIEEEVCEECKLYGTTGTDHCEADCVRVAIEALKKEPCEDAVSRAEVKKIAKEMYLEVANMELDAKTISDCISCTASKCREVLERKLQALPPVTPQEPNTWSLDDAREDFMHDVYNELDFLPTNEEANRIIDIFDRVTSSIEQTPRWIPVTERLPKKDAFYLVTEKSGRVRTYVFHKGNSEEYWKRCAVAWMPLPEPYEGGQEDDKA